MVIQIIRRQIVGRDIRVLKSIGWFAVAYACISITVTVLMLVFANKTFKLGGPIGMLRSGFLLTIALFAVIAHVFKSIFGGGTQQSLDSEIKSTVRKTSNWIDGLKKEWDDGKKR